jgi:hypothetical protein
LSPGIAVIEPGGTIALLQLGALLQRGHWPQSSLQVSQVSPAWQTLSPHFGFAAMAGQGPHSPYTPWSLHCLEPSCPPGQEHFEDDPGAHAGPASAVFSLLAWSKPPELPVAEHAGITSAAAKAAQT